MQQRPDGQNSKKAPAIIPVAAALIFRNRKLLLTQRRIGDHLGGLWEFPGGKVECGESFEKCLEREIREEVGLSIEPGELLEELTHSYPEKTVHLKFFKCRWISGEPEAIHCENFAWATREELSNFEFPAADARLIERLRNCAELWE